MKLSRKIQEKYHVFLRTIFKDIPKSLYLFFFTLFLLYAILPLFFYPNPSFYKLYYTNSKILLWIWIVSTAIYIPLNLRISKFYSEIPTPQLEKTHLAIIIVKYDIFFKSMFYMLINVKKFLNRLRKNNVPFSVYLVNNKDEFMKVINNPKVRVVFVLGHGQKHGIKFGNELWHYCNIPKVSHIKYVAQFHCNHYTGKSLHEHLECKGSLLTEDVTIYQDINKFIDSEKYLSNLKKLLKVK
jgi:hypothetical protein